VGMQQVSEPGTAIAVERGSRTVAKQTAAVLGAGVFVGHVLRLLGFAEGPARLAPFVRAKFTRPQFGA
jgi:hypothetical protein